MKTRLKKAAGLTAAAAALLVAGAAGTATAAAPAAAPQRCHTTALAASLHSDDQDGVGNFGQDLALTNTSHQTCTVYGYPGLGLQNARHGGESIQVVWGSTYFAADPGRHTVTLKPGQSAYADVAWHAPYGVTSVTPSYLEITPPNETTHLTIHFAPGAIDDDTLHVTALSAHPVG